MIMRMVRMVEMVRMMEMVEMVRMVTTVTTTRGITFGGSLQERIYRFDKMQSAGSFLGANDLVIAGDVHVPAKDNI